MPATIALRARAGSGTRVLGPVLAVTSVVLLLAGCGGSGGTGSASSQPAADQFAAYRDCLQSHGVTLPRDPSGSGDAGGAPRPRPSGVPARSPNPDASAGGRRSGPGLPPGVDAEAWQAAQQACQSVRPMARPFGGQGRPDSSQFAAFRNCLSDHGVTVSGPGRLNTADPATAAALRVCAPLRPSAAPG